MDDFSRCARSGSANPEDAPDTSRARSAILQINRWPTICRNANGGGAVSDTIATGNVSTVNQKKIAVTDTAVILIIWILRQLLHECPIGGENNRWYIGTLALSLVVQWSEMLFCLASVNYWLVNLLCEDLNEE
jgi:hypothetical protein